MNDYEDLKYPQDVQVAINEDWLDLVDGAFEPDKNITTTEKANMLTYARGILAASVIEENHENVYEFAENVIEIPEGTVVELLSNTEIMIYDTSLELSEGDSIAVYSNGLAYTYKIVDLEQKPEGVLVIGEELAYEDAVASVDAEGIIEADLSNFVPAEGVTLNVEYEEASTYGLSRIGGSKKIKDIDLKKNIGGGTVSCKITNLKIHYKINSKGYQFTTTGTTVASYTVSGKKDLTLTLGYINIAGVGKISVDMIYLADGRATLSYSYNFETGIEKNYGSPTRKITNYSISTWHFSAQAELKASCKVGFYVDVPSFANGSIYGEAGVKAEPAVEVYGDGEKPTVCMDLPAYVFATVAYNLSVFGVDVTSETIEIYNRNNSPCRVCYHIEDGKSVKTCARPDSSSPVGKRGYYSTGAAGSGTYSGNCFVAPNVEEPIFEYELDEDGNATITKYIGGVYCLTIPEELDGYPVVAIGANAFKDNTSLGSVVIPDCVISIGENAFNGCTYLTSIILPNNNQFIYIDQGVLANTSSLCDVEISDYITEIRTSAFQQSGLVSLHLKDNITSIEKKAFYGCNKLSDLVLPKYLEKFGDSCFGDCDALKTVEIPRYISGCSNELYPNSTGGYGYTSPKGMFSECDNLKTITFARGITKISTDLFNNCTGLEEIVFPDTVTEIQSKAFYNCTNLREVTLPNKLTKIGILSFAGCSSLEKIDIPDSVTVIDSCAFRWCQNLSEIEMSARLKEIGTWAFADCTSLEELEIPNTVETVIRYYDGMTINKLVSPFEGCSNLQKVILQEGMKTVPSNLFKWCSTGLEEVVFPDSITKIGENAFNSCRDLKTIDLPDNLVEIGEAAFIACSSLESIEIPNTVKSMSPSIFEECSSLIHVKLPDYRIAINTATFKNCTSLTSIEFPDTLQYIYNNAFEGCEKLERIILPQGFKGIEKQAFKNCKRLSSVELNGDYIANNAFEGCIELVDIKMNNSIYNLGEAAFLNCSNLPAIQLSTSLKEVPANAFSGCTFLNDVVIPYGVTSIGDGAFKNCTSLNNIMIPQNVTAISNTAFSYPEEITVYGIEGSYAEEYANNNGMTFVPRNNKVESVDFFKKEYVVNVGSTVKIPINIAPENCNENVVWISSDEDVATVDNVGTIKGINPGECEITVSIGGISKECKVVVKNRVSGLKLNAVEQLEIEESVKITCISSDNMNIEAEELRWWSSDPNVVSVDQAGNITAHSKGKVTIEVWWLEDINVTAQTDIEVVELKDIPVTGITLEKTTLEMKLNTSEMLVANVLPNDASDTSVAWSSSNEEIVSVINGQITALHVGTATITVTTKDGDFSATCVVTVTEEEKGISLSQEKISLVEGDCSLLEAIVTATDINDHSVQWRVEDETIATMDSQTGIVKGIKAGKTTITATTADDKYQAICEVEVISLEEIEERIEVTEVSINANSKDLSEDKTIEIGKVIILCATVEPAEATNQNIIWISSNEEIATVTQEGVVTTVGTGEVTFTAVSENGAKQAEITIQVLGIAVTDIKLNKTNIELSIGEEVCLQADVQPDNAVNKNIIWSSDDASIATVDKDGNVTGVAAGTTKINVEACDGSGVKKTCVVMVIKADDPMGTPTDTPSQTPTDTPTNTPSQTPTDTPTNTTSQTPTDTPNQTLDTGGQVSQEDKPTDGNIWVDYWLDGIGYSMIENENGEIGVEILNYKGTDKSLFIPEYIFVDDEFYDVTAIADNAFKNNKKLTYIVIGDNVKTIGKNAFGGCTNLKKVEFGRNLERVGYKAFYNCKKLTKAIIPSKVTQIDSYAFKNCKKLSSVTIGKSVKTIGKEAFKGCGKLKSVNIRSTKLKTVGKNAIKGINKKATIKVPKKQCSKYKKLFKSKTGYKKTMKIR